jgi:exodeoxyribonuclease VII large subunit
MNLDNKDREMVLTVGQFLDSVNYLLSTGRPIVSGEISELKITDKWASFSLQDKDEKAILKCVMGIWEFRRIGLEIADGMEVKVGGVPRMTKSYGSFALWVSSIEPVGEGSLKKAYQLLLKKLELEGLFARKRELPEYITNVGVISSKDGVVIHDFVKNLKPLNINIKFINTRVEGKDAVNQLIKAISWFNRKMPDLDAIVIIRGGGSLESMQAFNNEVLCREIFGSKIPVIAGIGHDVDVPIACMVADVSVSTPTAVANLINSSWDSLVFDLPSLEDKIFMSYDSSLRGIQNKAQNFIVEMVGHIKSVFANFESLSKRIIKDAVSSITVSIERKIDFIDRAEKIINIANPERNLRLGYSLTTDSEDKIVRDIKKIKRGDVIKTLLANGSIESTIDNVNI